MKRDYAAHCIDSALDMRYPYQFRSIGNFRNPQWCGLKVVEGCCRKDFRMAHLHVARYRYQQPEGMEGRTEHPGGGSFGAGLAVYLSKVARIFRGLPVRSVLF